jgi:hypothetical protein
MLSLLLEFCVDLKGYRKRSKMILRFHSTFPGTIHGVKGAIILRRWPMKEKVFSNPCGKGYEAGLFHLG